MRSRLSLASRSLAIAASVLVHATAFASIAFTTLGHGPARVEDGTVSIELLTEAPPTLPAEVPSPRPSQAEHAAPETHHHPYAVAPSHDVQPHDPSLVHAPATPHDHDHDHEHAPPPAPREAAPAVAEAPARFTIVLPPAGNGGASTALPASTGAPGAGDALGTGTDHGSADTTTFSESAVAMRATLLASATAIYPPQAREAEVEADVPVEIVVDPGGRVLEARVVTPAGYGLDEAALRAIRAYRFTPARRDGHAVRVRMRWSVQFRLR